MLAIRLMRFTIEIESNDDAFVDETVTHDFRGRYEIARILTRVCEDVKSGHCDGTIVDINGHRCGQWSLEEDEEC